MFFTNFLCAATLLLVWLIQWIYKWRNPRCKGELPPGSMGLPLIGETMEFMAPSSSFDMHPFIKKRMKRYGLVFKTSLFGLQLVVSTDPELNHFVFQQEGKMFKSWYPSTFKHLFGLDDTSDLNDAMSKYLKSLILKVLGPENLKQQLLHDVDKETQKRLCLWSTNESSIELKDSIATLLFDVITKTLMSYDPSTTTVDLMSNFTAFISSVFSFPLNIPGTAYRKSLQGRKNVMNVLKRLLSERISSPREESKDYLDILAHELRKNNSKLTEKLAVNLIFVIIIASFESTSRTLTLAIKFLSENPKILEDLTDEHEVIIRNRDDPDSEVTWEEYKSMSFTHQVINEAGRLANIVPANFRKTMKDFAINGYIIPKDWIVMVYPPATHLNPEMHEDPLTFNPSRWKDKVELNRAGKNFLVFGGGMRYCVGAEFSKMEMAIFLHYLVTKCRWKVVKGGNIVRSPGLEFPDGYHVQLMPKNLGVL